MTEFQMLITWLAGIGGFIVAILALIEHRKGRKEKRFWARREEEEKNNELKMRTTLNRFRTEVIQDIEKIIKSSLVNYTTIEKNDRDNEKINKDLMKINMSLKEHNKQFIEYQKQSLAAEIVRFADHIRRGHEKTRSSYTHIASAYNRYKELGGNHYVDEEWKYILEAMKNETN